MPGLVHLIYANLKWKDIDLSLDTQPFFHRFDQEKLLTDALRTASSLAEPDLESYTIRLPFAPAALPAFIATIGVSDFLPLMLQFSLFRLVGKCAKIIISTNDRISWVTAIS
jgi:hypothetical protein